MTDDLIAAARRLAEDMKYTVGGIGGLLTALADEVERLEAKVRRMAREQLTPVMENEMLVTDLAAVADRLQQWKREALTVLGEWEKIWDDLGQPGNLGLSKAAITREWVQAYKSDALRLAERLNAVRALADRWEHLTDGPDETWTDEVHALGTSVWHAPVFAAELRAALDDTRQEPHTPSSRPESLRPAQNHTGVSSGPQESAQRLDGAPDGTLLGIERPGPFGRVDTLDVYEHQEGRWLRYGDGAWLELDPDHLIWPHRILWQPSPP